MWNNELILDEIIYQRGLTNQDIIKELDNNGIDKYVDIYADSSEPKSIEEIYRGGYNCKPVQKGADSIRYGIDILKDYKMWITSRSGNLQKELKKYVWAKDKTGKPLNRPIDAYNHAIDASRYSAMELIGKVQEYDIYI
jgi:phage terminase large subunit